MPSNSVPPVPACRLTLDGFPDGGYEVEWWETWRGAPARREVVRAEGGRLILLPGEIATDVAARIRPAGAGD